MPPETLSIPKDLAQAVVNYLATRPYQEVHQFMPALLSLQPIPQPEPKPETKETEE